MAGADRFSSLPPEVTGGGPVASSWIEGVHHVVSSFRGPLLHFALSQCFSSDQSVLLQRLLDLLLQKNSLETLNFSSYLFNCARVVIHLPSFYSLKKLKLFGCRIVLPTGFQGFECLSTLILRFVQISNDDLNLLIHISNSLTTLECLDIVASNDQPFSIKLSLPSLRYLKIFFDYDVDKVEVVSAPCLERASILNYTHSDFQKLALVTLWFLTSLVMVSSLDLGFDVLKSLSLATLPTNFTFPRVRLLKLSLKIRAMDKRMCDAFIWLLCSMPFLKDLNIQVIFSFFFFYFLYQILLVLDVFSLLHYGSLFYMQCSKSNGHSLDVVAF
ncbi:F-box/RNI/FBD-like domain protein [Rhynchospora pubera]|uniref:F-box/RNI/FBD-like domain protein n=1 Tax=Rhynchospora pubera TaxID=906938 RepID=A0AAV8FW44_9POAL|nr:F-box/RNI/FBD-like domain protein [Rhynchospora pubera]